MRNRLFASTAALFAALVFIAVAPAADWGSLKGRFVVDGTAPTPAPVNITKDAEYCGQHKLVNESVLVGKNNSLVNAVVFLRAPLGKKVDVHPDYEAKLKEPVVLDNHFCTFKPHIVLLRVGQKLEIKNSDPPPIGHNTKIELFSFNQTVASNGQTEVTDSKDFALPTPVECNIHPWMKAHLVSLAHPYMAASSEDGTFEIKNIPAGQHEFQFWHEAPGYLKNMKLKTGTTDARGRAKLTIAAGQTLDLGDIKVPAKVLVPK
jgi:hypothetical protein